MQPPWEGPRGLTGKLADSLRSALSTSEDHLQEGNVADHVPSWGHGTEAHPGWGWRGDTGDLPEFLLSCPSAQQTAGAQGIAEQSKADREQGRDSASHRLPSPSLEAGPQAWRGRLAQAGEEVASC